MGQKNLTDRTLRALKPAPAGTTVDWWDAGFPGFGVRVSDTGRRTFVLAARFGGSINPTRRALGVYGPLTLEHARDKARGWLKLIERGVDPKEEEERERLKEHKRRKNTFAAVADDFIAEKLPAERNGREAERDLRGVFVPAWVGRPITEISDIDVLAIIKAKAKTAPIRARNLLALLKRFFAWAIDQRVYEIHGSPCERLKPSRILGERMPRQRELTDAEIVAFWHAVGQMPYPYGPAYRLLLLTGLRLNEVADAAWGEFHPAVLKALRERKPGANVDWKAINKRHLQWVIPATRMKGKNSRARPHAIPLVPEVLAILETLPMFSGGDFVFSTTAGKKPAWMGDKIKKKLDTEMLVLLRANAGLIGEDPRKVRLEAWTNHDLRRVVRSGLSRLRIPDHVSEAILAHTPAIISKTYNVDDLFEQKAEALTAWASRLRDISEPPPANVTPLHGRA